jgi:hypothetical protein
LEITIRRTEISPNGTIFNVVILGQLVRGIVESISTTEEGTIKGWIRSERG